MSEFFRFEDKELDIPFYNNEPHISKKGWAVLLCSIPIAFLCYILIGEYSELIGSWAFCLVLALPLMHYSNYDLSLIMHKPTRKELRLALFLFIGYIIYAMVIGDVADAFLSVGYVSMGIEQLIILAFSMMAEEILKFIPFVFLMKVFYGATKSRKLAIILSTLIVMVFFGLLHYDFEAPIMQCILIQGFGSIFEFYGYIKTKNILVPYLSHLLTDAAIMLIVFLAGG